MAQRDDSNFWFWAVGVPFFILNLLTDCGRHPENIRQLLNAATSQPTAPARVVERPECEQGEILLTSAENLSDLLSEASRATGLRFRQVKRGGINISFVSRLPGDEAAHADVGGYSIVAEYDVLRDDRAGLILAHELGHIAGMAHASSGLMAPSLEEFGPPTESEIAALRRLETCPR